MENHFAGAADLGDRRRRRLANSDDDQAFSDAPGGRVTLRDSASCQDTSLDARILRRMISPRLWKHVSILTAVLIGLVSASLAGQRGVASEFFPAVCGLLLILSGQLAVLTGWLRSQSDVDFQGRYRWWKWFAAALSISGLLTITNSFVLVPPLASSLVASVAGPIYAARYAIVLVPSTLFAVLVLSRIIPDMGRNLQAQLILVGALLTLIVWALLRSGAATTSISERTLQALTSAACYQLFAAMLLHCRFVAYVNNDPPVISVRKPKATEEAVADEKLTEDRSADSTVPDLSKSDATGQASTRKPAATRKKKRKSSGRKAA